ncbi:hypothetical protein HK097_004592, partial [Rhizophlyctis rosea]
MPTNSPPKKGPSPSASGNKNDSGGIHRMVWSDVSFDKNGKPAMVESYYLLDSKGNVAGFGTAKPSNRMGNSNAKRKELAESTGEMPASTPISDAPARPSMPSRSSRSPPQRLENAIP